MTINSKLDSSDFDNIDDALAAVKRSSGQAVKRASEAGLYALRDSERSQVRIRLDASMDPQTIFDHFKAIQTLLVQVTNANPS